MLRLDVLLIFVIGTLQNALVFCAFWNGSDDGDGDKVTIG